MTTSPETLKRTPLHDVHVALGAKMVPFAGFEMPVTGSRAPRRSSPTAPSTKRRSSTAA